MSTHQASICELEKRDLDATTAIVESFLFEDSVRKEVIANIAHEFTELGINRLFFLARLERQPAGMVQLILRHADNDPELADGRTIAHIHSLWVSPHLQRCGLGSALMRHVEQAAKARGVTTLTLGFENHNTGAAAFYRTLRYVEFKRKPGRVPGEELVLLWKRIST
jgi:ribosomal protein S18 acetylase RimI-like enzyme